MVKAHLHPNRRLVALFAPVAALLLVAAACGSDDSETTTDAASGDETTDSTVGSDGDDTDDDSDGDHPEGADDSAGHPEGDPEGDDDSVAVTPVVGDGSDYAPTTSRDNLNNLQPWPIDDVVVADDDQTIGVRYTGASEPCSGAKVTVTEDDSTVTVELESGLDPDAATMSCIAGLVGYEIAVELDAPVGDRALMWVNPDDSVSDPDPSDDDPSDDDGSALSPPEAFIGLSTADAGAKADAEGRAWRIGREDGEDFILTDDFIADRLTFDVEAGLVTAAVLG